MNQNLIILAALVQYGFDMALRVQEMLAADAKPLTRDDIIALRAMVKPFSAYDPTLPPKGLVQ